MARTSVASQSIVRPGLTAALTAPTVDGDIVDAGDRCFLEVANGSGAPITVTAVTPGTQDGLAISDLIVSVPAAGNKRIGPFPARTFAQASDAVVGAGRVLIDYSAVASVTRGFFVVGA